MTKFSRDHRSVVEDVVQRFQIVLTLDPSRLATRQVVGSQMVPLSGVPEANVSRRELRAEIPILAGRPLVPTAVTPLLAKLELKVEWTKLHEKLPATAALAWHDRPPMRARSPVSFLFLQSARVLSGRPERRIRW